MERKSQQRKKIRTNSWEQVVVNYNIISYRAHVRIASASSVPNSAICSDILIVIAGVRWVGWRAVLEVRVDSLALVVGDRVNI